jgi:hypothetical protein
MWYTVDCLAAARTGFIHSDHKTHFTFHGDTIAALAGTALLVLGVVEASTIVLPATGELLRRGVPMPTR